MVKTLFHGALILCFIVLQTSVFPRHEILNDGFDLLIIIVLFFSLNFSHPALLAICFFMGCCMDSFSGAPFGLYTAAYLWIFISVWMLKRFVHPGNLIFLPLISGAAVSLENAFLFFSFFVRHGSSALSLSDIVFAGYQALWAFVLIPVAIMFVEWLHSRCDKLDAGLL